MINIVRPTMRLGQNPMIGYEAMIGIILKSTIANITSKIVPNSSFLKNNYYSRWAFHTFNYL